MLPAGTKTEGIVVRFNHFRHSAINLWYCTGTKYNSLRGQYSKSGSHFCGIACTHTNKIRLIEYAIRLQDTWKLKPLFQKASHYLSCTCMSFTLD